MFKFTNYICKFNALQTSNDASNCCLRGKGVLREIFEEDFPNPKRRFFACQERNAVYFHEYVESGVDDVFIIRVANRKVIECFWGDNIIVHLYLYVIVDFRSNEPRFMIEIIDEYPQSKDEVVLVFTHSLNRKLHKHGLEATLEKQDGESNLPECLREVMEPLRNKPRSIEEFYGISNINEYYKMKERMKVIPNNNDEQKDESLLDDLKERLKPIFYNHDENIKLFLKTIRGMKQNDITDLVNKWVSERLISNFGYSRKGVLWTILHDAGLYKRSKQNWCRRVY